MAVENGEDTECPESAFYELLIRFLKLRNNLRRLNQGVGKNHLLKNHKKLDSLEQQVVYAAPATAEYLFVLVLEVVGVGGVVGGWRGVVRGFEIGRGWQLPLLIVELNVSIVKCVVEGEDLVFLGGGAIVVQGDDELA